MPTSDASEIVRVYNVPPQINIKDTLLGWLGYNLRINIASVNITYNYTDIVVSAKDSEKLKSFLDGRELYNRKMTAETLNKKQSKTFLNKILAVSYP